MACWVPSGGSGAYRDGGSEAEEDHGGTHVDGSEGCVGSMIREEFRVERMNPETD